MMAPLSALCERSDFKLFHLNSSSHNGEIVQLQSALNDDSNNFQENSNACHISEPIIGRFFPNLVLVRSLRGSFIVSFSSAKKRCNTSQGFGAFFGHSCDRDQFLFPFITGSRGVKFVRKNYPSYILPYKIHNHVISSINLPNATFVCFHTLYFSISISLSTPYRPQY